jgi:5-methylcytosine-specific restriction endonuclease McrA
VTEDVHPYVVYVRDSWVCYLCAAAVDRYAAVPMPLAPTLDHVVPLVNGGAHTYSNIKTAHFICNSLKRDTPLQEFLTKHGS